MTFTLNRSIAPEATSEYNFHFLEPESIVLSNGIPIYFVHGSQQEVIRIELIYSAGNGYESLNMLASATNDLIGDGTSSRTSEQINEYLDFYGSYLSRETSRDHGMLGLFSLNKNLSHVLPVLQEILLDSVFPEHELDIYLNNRKARFMDGMKKTDYVCRNQFGRLLYGQHPYGKPLRIDDFDHLSRQNVMDFYQVHYRNFTPMVFVAGYIGDAEKKQIIEMLESLTPGSFQKSIEEVPAYQPAKEKIHMTDTIQSAIRIGKPMIGMEHPDYPALAIANMILGGYFGSRLMKNIREEKGYTYGIGSGLSSFEKSGMFVVATEVGREVTDSAVHEIYKEIRILQEELVKEEELMTVRNYLLGNFLKSIDGPFAQTDKIKTKILRRLPSDYYEKYLKAIREVNPVRIRDIMNQYLSVDTLSELVVGDH